MTGEHMTQKLVRDDEVHVITVVQKRGHEGEFYVLRDDNGDERTIGDGTEEYWAIANAIDSAYQSGEADGTGRYIARFNPQEWYNNNAVEVEPAGDQEWDCTAFINSLDTDRRSRLLRGQTTRGVQVLDNDDLLKADPDAPEWVRNWRGPFDIWIRKAESTEEDESEFGPFGRCDTCGAPCDEDGCMQDHTHQIALP